MTSEFLTVLTGVGTTLALITAIGAQNAFILKQGLLGRFVLPIVLFCISADVLLYALGVSGMGLLVQSAPWLLVALRWGGVLFLLVYGLMAARRALFPTGEALVVTEQDAVGPEARLPEDSSRPAPREQTLGTALLTCAAMTFLNPHTYLDTMVLVGSVANQHGPTGRWWFFLGSCLGSTLWFFALGFGAALLRPLFARPATWRFLDGGIALLMLALSARLAVG